MHSSSVHERFFNPKLVIAFFWVMLISASFAAAQTNPFAPGWDIEPSVSQIEFGSIKHEKGKKVLETHSFAIFAGSIEDSGDVKITVKMDSVDTKNDLRNVRMRFLFFESFKYPDGVISLKLTPDMVEGLAPGSRKVLTVPFDLKIKEVSNRLSAEVLVVVDSNDKISISSETPVILRIKSFGLSNNLRKIAETAGGFEIEPLIALNFDLTFKRRKGGEIAQVIAVEQQPAVAAALETKGDFSLEECVGRFQILSETGNIYFASGSARLESDSEFVLATVLDIVERCPTLRILISGHTDNDGSNSYNQSLSERRAKSVSAYMNRKGVNPQRLFVVGFGEDQPMVANDSVFNKGRNRRIEFSLYK